MAYNPTVWVNDSVPDIDADNMNKIEQGIETADANATSAKTEVEDIRNGANGVTYPSAGNAVRSQVTNLTSQINNLNGELVDGTYINSNIYQGARNFVNPKNISANNARCTSDVLELKKGDTISVSNIVSGQKFAIGGKPTYDSGWKTADFSVDVGADGLYFVNFAKSDGTTSILPSEVTSQIKVIKNGILPIENKNKIALIESDLDLSTKFSTMEFSYVSGTGHSSSADKLSVNIKQGDSFYVKSENALPYLSLYAWYSDGTNTNILSSSNSGFETCLVAQKDIIALSVYFSAPSASGTYTLLVSYGIKKDINELQKRSDEVGTIRKQTFDYVSGTAHSSTKDKIFIGIKNGEKFIFSIDSAISGSIEVRGYYGSNQSEIIRNVTGKSDNVFTASKDYFAIGLYFGSQSSSGTANVSVITGTEIDLFQLESKSDEVLHRLPYARHVANNLIKPLTILHFSDIHAEANVMNAILAESEKYDYDEAICTGDMVGGTYAQIESWWNEKVLTCIGNHDTASYNSETGYDWTALSMAERDNYYIAPFESNWGIIHTSGTSYYYKDYVDQKIRLIVMDAMLYTDNGDEATAQTSWLSGLLSDAITNNYHVLIAIHAPHGGSTAKECSFSRYNQATMPTLTDCNTPQVVIDTVASAISLGLNFIGYIVGHTHQDNIWKATEDGSQLMYCITCAALTEAQWKGSDQFRNLNNNAYNLITIDTYNRLVKIIRGGGANIDDHMRTREAICFNYSTGDVVGEVK